MDRRKCFISHDFGRVAKSIIDIQGFPKRTAKWHDGSTDGIDVPANGVLLDAQVARETRETGKGEEV